MRLSGENRTRRRSTFRSVVKGIARQTKSAAISKTCFSDGKRADQRSIGALAQCDERRIGLDDAGRKCRRHPRGELVVAALDV